MPQAPFEAEIRQNPYLLQWYDANKLTGLVDGNRVAAIGDQSGHGWTLTKLINGPVYRVAGLNGYPTMEFSSSDCILGASAEILPYTDFTIIAVMSAWSAGRPFGWENDGSGVNGLGYFTSPQWIIRDSGNNWDISTAGYSGAVPHFLTLRVRNPGGGLSIIWTTSGNRIFRFANSAAVSWSSAGQTFKLGSSGNGGAPATVNISEFLTFRRYLDDASFTRILAQLSEKYGWDSGVAIGGPQVLETVPPRAAATFLTQLTTPPFAGGSIRSAVRAN